jgi:diguanylate cyclase (GGDEF)-like protein
MLLTVGRRIVDKIRRAFLGAKVLDEENRKVFVAEILETSRKRIQVFFGLSLFVQLSNLIIDPLTNAHPVYSRLYREGSLWFLAVAAVFLVLFQWLKKNPDLSLMAKYLIARGGWALALASSLFFCLGDFLEHRGITNFTLMILANGVLPVMDVVETLAFLSCYLGANAAFAALSATPAHLYQQMVILAALSLYSARIQYNSSLAVFIERHRLSEINSTLERLAETDPLTGLLNRRGMEKFMQSILGPFRRRGDRICMLMLDIDHFKAFNDKYLHLAGDKCLKQIAQCLRSCVHRSTDMIARYGGEEFVIAAKNIDERDLPPFASRIRRAVEELCIPFGHEEGMPCITVSIGAACLEMDIEAESGEAFMKRLIDLADKELYNAKASGRNCVSFHGEIVR